MSLIQRVSHKWLYDPKIAAWCCHPEGLRHDVPGVPWCDQINYPCHQPVITDEGLIQALGVRYPTYSPYDITGNMALEMLDYTAAIMAPEGSYITSEEPLRQGPRVLQRVGVPCRPTPYPALTQE